MFENLTDRLTRVIKSITGQSHLSEENIEKALREVRISLIEADVALPVIKEFIEDIKQKAIGTEVLKNLKPDQAFIKLVHEELIALMGGQKSELNFKTQPPAIFLMVGLQGSGKTTTSAKLARFLKENEKKKIMMVSTDVYRPAAIEQLQILAKDLDIPFFEATPKDKPLNIAKAALESAKKQFVDVLIVDTAGRLHIDDVLMDEVQQLHKTLQPSETFFVVDSMTGQDAVHAAKAFHDAVPITGIILTKTDGDARGGAALSVLKVTGQPIKFMGHGEKIDAFEPFHPERVASRILGMGDILTLIEEVERKTDKNASEKLAKKLKKGSFDLEDFKQQLLQMNNLGGVTGMMSKLPGMNKLPQVAGKVNDDSIKHTIAMINAMTKLERRVPKIIMGSRKKRIALGSGKTIQDVNRLLKQFEQMQKMIKKFSKPGSLQKMMRGMGGMPGLSGLEGILPDDFK